MSGASENRPTASSRWFRLLLRLYPAIFRDEMGDDLVATYEARARAARDAGRGALAGVWLRALGDSVRNGLGERVNPAWRHRRGWGRDTQLVFRRLRRAPTFTLAILGTLTVGLGAFTAVYTVVNQILVAPLPYQDADDLYFVWRDYSEFFDLDRGWVAGTDVVEFENAGDVIESAVGIRRGRASLTGDGARPEEIRVMVTTPNLFEVLGVNPWLGRGFSPEDAGAGAGRVVVLSYPLWNTLGSDQAIVGRDLRVDGDPFTVIGVMPEGFDFQGHSSLGAPEGADAYLVFDYDLATTNPGAGSFAGLIRAREGTPVPVVEAAVEAVGRAIDERDFQGRGMRFYPVALKPDLVAGVRPALLVVGFAGGFLLLVLLVNLASLLLVRTVERERELAVSRALGANKVALLRATMLEGGVLGLAGGIAGAVAAMWATRVFVSLAPPDFPRLGQVGVDWSVGLTAAGVGLALGLLASSLPAIWATRPALGGLLSAAAVRGGGGHGRARRGMVVVQVALSFVLLTAGGLVVRSFSELLRANPGFDPSGVLTFRVPIADVDSVAQALPRQADIQRELARIPGVTAVGAVGALPFGGGGNQTSITVGGAPGNIGDDDVDHPLIDVFEVLPGYFAAMGIQIVEGRALEFDRPEGLQEALIDEHIARQFFPSGGAIGAEIQLNQSFTTVVGVVRHARYYDVHRDGRPQMFVRNEQAWGSPSLSYVVRSTRSPASLGREVRAAVARVDAQLPVSRLEPLEDIVAGSLSQQRVSAVLIAAFSLGALLLAAMGVFGAVSGSVTRRRQELAVRLAVGADHRRVLRHVVAEGAILVGFGLLVGIPGVYFGGRIIQGVLVGVSPSDPATLLAVAAGLVVIALVACWIPARRVMTIEPASVLRRG